MRDPAAAASVRSPPAPQRPSVPSAPAPSLRVVDAIALIVGTVVGAGIFRTPSLVAANVPSEYVAILAWIAGGAISLIGALCYAELTTTYPNAGGDYHYLTRAFGRRLAFLFGWARITVIQTGSIALLAFVIGDYAARLVPIGGAGAAIYAALTVAAVTAINVVGTRQGKARAERADSGGDPRADRHHRRGTARACRAVVRGVER
jgi:basic amino acid/polyamine antiporter, APA family